tara:strand:+ start:356 stop:802 length:447 start_codon:yes stop_codon:yes gene_type:complete
MSSDVIPVKVILTHPQAQIPMYKNAGDAGADVRSIYSVTLSPGSFKMVDLGMRIELPPGYEMQVRSRSGLAAKHGIFVLNGPGTIDSGYRGDCKVILANFGDEPYAIAPGERIAQFVLKRAPSAQFELVDGLGISERGRGGFGSTGTK